MRRRDLFPLLTAPAFLRAQSARPAVAQGAAVGDVAPGTAVIWSRTDRPAQMLVEYSTTESFRDPRRVTGPTTSADSDWTARTILTGLPADQQIFCRVSFAGSGKDVSEPVLTRFRTAPASRRNVRFVWSGDTVGQGWGINPDDGGMKGYETMRRRNPDFFVHSGDTIYADNPVPAEIKLPDGGVWRNITTEAKSHIAQTLADFRGNYLYNLLDENVRRFQSEVPQIWAWDDHEVMNNWSPGKDLSANAAYTEKRIQVLAGRAGQAFREYAPLHLSQDEPARIYRKISYGPLLDVFVLDMRSYRGPNNWNRQTTTSAEDRYLGRPQLEWLENGLANSKAVWKVIAADMPVGVLVPDGKDSEGRTMYEASANGDGPPLGRELELSELLRSLKRRKVANTVWITADVHYTAAHYYDPAKAQFSDFDPFWEFISGPIHAGTFGPGVLDNTFGPQVIFQKHPPKGSSNLSPRAGLQFFGEMEVDGRSSELTVRLMDTGGDTLWTKTLAPRGA